VDFRDAPEEDAERLFGGVLPTHPTLATVELTCDVPARHLSLFAAALASARAAGVRGAPLALLHVGGTGFDRERAQAIATILRSNGPLVSLCVSPKAGVEADNCKLLFRSLSSNTTLRRFDIRVKKVLADTLDYDASSASLQELCVSSENPFPHGAVASLAAQLRTNTALTVLSMNEATAPGPMGGRSEVLRPIASVLETYNFTLQHVHLSSPLAESAVAGSIRELLRRNRRIRYMVGALRSLGDYHRLLPPPQWLAALGTASRFPTLLYRFFRRGDANELCARLGRGGSERVRALIDVDEGKTSLPEEDTTRLFGDALPAHPRPAWPGSYAVRERRDPFTIAEALSLRGPSPPTRRRHRRRYESSPSTMAPFGRDMAEAIADLIGRNVPLYSRTVRRPLEHHRRRDGCRMLPDPISSTMTLEGMGALPDMLDVAVEAESHVQRLQVCITAPLPDGFVARIARGAFARTSH
jgi:hypothetical protein